MEFWEYKTLTQRKAEEKFIESESHPSIDDIEDVLNKLGHNGWELITINLCIMYFKRQR